MKRVLFILLGLTAAMTVLGLVFAFTRPISWPANVRPVEWGRTLGEKVEPQSEEATA